MVLMNFAIYYALITISIAAALSAVRILRGPTTPDRVVALDVMSVNAIAFIAVYAIETNHSSILDVAIILGLLSFLGTVAFAFYLERRSRQ